MTNPNDERRRIAFAKTEPKSPMQKATQLWIEKPAELAGLCPKCGREFGDAPYCKEDGSVAGEAFVLGGRYRVEECIGTGGMAMVFAGRHTILGKKVAIKIMRDELACDADKRERFLREARVSAALRHDNIVDVLDFGRDEKLDLSYIVMPHLRGVRLDRLIQKSAPLNVERALSILLQLARAISYAHEEGVFHRDLNPRNIILENCSGRSDVVRLCDFGLARLLDGDDRITAAGEFLGTPAYMAPEQIRGDEDQDQGVDIFAFGVTAYEMLTGELPFQGDTAVAIMAEKLTGKAKPFADDSNLPIGLKSLVMSILEIDKTERASSFANIERTLEDLTHASAGLSIPRSLIDQKVGSFIVKELAGTGGLAEVYRGEHPTIGNEVAIKVLLPDALAVRHAAERFILEAKISSAFDHPSLVRFFDYGKLPDGRPYAVMEFLRGETLEQRLSRIGRYSINETREILGDIVDALSLAHAAGAIHRDLKPDNIFFANTGSGEIVKLIDFGIAQSSQHEAQTKLTQVGGFIGTPDYCAPEQVFGGELNDKVDVYSLGVTAFEMLTGDVPFTESNLATLLQTKTKADAPDIRERMPELGEHAAATINSMLVRNPDERPSLADLRERLRHWELREETPTQIIQAASKTNKKWAFGAAAAAVLLIVTISLLSLRSSGPEEEIEKSGSATIKTVAAEPVAKKATLAPKAPAAIPAKAEVESAKQVEVQATAAKPAIAAVKKKKKPKRRRRKAKLAHSTKSSKPATAKKQAKKTKKAKGDVVIASPF